MTREIVLKKVEKDLTAPVVASIELSKMFVRLTDKVEALENQTRRIEDDEGNVSTLDHPDLYKWTKLQFTVLSKIADYTKDLNNTVIEQKFNATKLIIENVKDIPEEIKEKLIRMQMNQDNV